MKVANIGLGFAILLFSCMLIFFIYVTKNTLTINKNNDRIRKEGFKTQAIINKASPDNVQNVEGRTLVHLEISYTDKAGNPVSSKKDISIATFNSGDYQPKKIINIIVDSKDNKAVIVDGDNVSN